MPKISDATRSRRRAHILTSAWGCFALDGFQATSMDDVIAATGMSSSAVYRYFRSKDEIIDATVEEGLTRVRDFFIRLLAETPTPSPAQAFAFMDARLKELAAHPRQDMTRIAMQTWAEALRRPPLQERTRTLYNQALDDVTELASHWLSDGHLPPGADPRGTASTFFTLMQGMIVCNHLVGGVSLEDLLHGVSALGSALAQQPSGALCTSETRSLQRRGEQEVKAVGELASMKPGKEGTNVSREGCAARDPGPGHAAGPTV